MWVITIDIVQYRVGNYTGAALFEIDSLARNVPTNVLGANRIGLVSPCRVASDGAWNGNFERNIERYAKVPRV